jgi:hypothetical protein
MAVEQMTFEEKILYHQIHPLKLSVDIGTSLLTTYFAWQHNIVWFLVLFLIPSIVATMALIKFADLERLKTSSFGKYIEKYMTRLVEVIRFAGQIIMWVSAWFHLPILIAIGVSVIIAGWLNGLLFKR